MSSNIRLKAVCQHCGDGFIAKTTKTKYCSLRCGARAYKVRERKEKVEQFEKATSKLLVEPLIHLQAKEVLTVKEASKYLGVSTRTIYRLIENGELSAVNLGTRLLRISKKSIENIFQWQA